MLYNEYMVKEQKKRTRKMRFGVLTDVILIIALLLLCMTVVLVGSGTEGKINFNYNTGFYNRNLEIKMSRDRIMDGFSGYTIRYTIDGDDVSYNSGDGTNGVELIVPENGYSVYTVKAALCNEEECKKTNYATYVLGNTLAEDTDIRIVSLVSSHKNLYDYDSGILVPGRIYDENAASNPSAYIYGNYHERKKEWLRDAHATIFDKGETVFDNDIMIGTSGDSSAAMEIKSLKMVSENKDALLPLLDKGYENIRLRGGAQDQKQGNIRSSVVSRLAKESGYNGCPDTVRVTVFLNNEFYSLFDMQQTVSDSFFSNIYGIKNPHLVEKFKGTEKNVLDQNNISGLFNHSSWREEDMDKLESLVDIDDYLLYYALQILWNNMDWPMGNYGLWKYTGHTDGSNNYEDGKYRFFIYDTDMVYYSSDNILYYDGADGDIFVDIMENRKHGLGSTFRNVIKAPSYREKFISIMQGLINGPFKTENVLRIIDEEATKIDHQMKLFYSDEEYEEWKDWIEIMKNAASSREDEIRADMKKYFGVSL